MKKFTIKGLVSWQSAIESFYRFTSSIMKILSSLIFVSAIWLCFVTTPAQPTEESATGTANSGNNISDLKNGKNVPTIDNSNDKYKLIINSSIILPETENKENVLVPKYDNKGKNVHYTLKFELPLAVSKSENGDYVLVPEDKMGKHKLEVSIPLEDVNAKIDEEKIYQSTPKPDPPRRRSGPEFRIADFY